MIRPARHSDLASVTAVHLAGFRAGNGPHVDASRLAELSLERRQAVWASLIRHPSPATAVLVAEPQGDVTAVAAAGQARDDDVRGEGEVYALYAEPSRWGTGDAVALHAAVLKHLRRHGFTRARVWTLVANARARRFYEREGWGEDGLHEERFGTRVLRLRRDV